MEKGTINLKIEDDYMKQHQFHNRLHDINTILYYAFITPKSVLQTKKSQIFLKFSHFS